MSDTAEQSLFSELIDELLTIFIARSADSYKLVIDQRMISKFSSHDWISESMLSDILIAFNTFYLEGSFTDNECTTFTKVIGDILVNASKMEYDDNGTDVSIKYLSVILGAINPQVVPSWINFRQLIKDSLQNRSRNFKKVSTELKVEPYYPIMRTPRRCVTPTRCTILSETLCNRCELGNPHMIMDDEVDTPLYQYLQYVCQSNGDTDYACFLLDFVSRHTSY